jgi:hypothetical protein
MHTRPICLGQASRLKSLEKKGTKARNTGSHKTVPKISNIKQAVKEEKLEKRKPRASFQPTYTSCSRTLPYNDFPGLKYAVRLPKGLRVHLPRTLNCESKVKVSEQNPAISAIDKGSILKCHQESHTQKLESKIFSKIKNEKCT